MTDDAEYGASLLRGHIKSLGVREDAYLKQARNLEHQALLCRERAEEIKNQIDVAEKVLHNLEGDI